MGLGDAVEGALVVIQSADHGANRPVGRQGHQGALRDPPALAKGLHSIAHRLQPRRLKFWIDGQAHDQVRRRPARQGAGLGGRLVEDVAVVAFSGARGRQRRGRRQRVGVLGRGDPAFIPHDPQDLAGAGHGAGHVVGQGQARGCVGHRGQQRRLGQGQLARRMAEVGLGRGVQAIGAGAEEGAVQVQLQHLILAKHRLQIPGEHRLLHLPLEGVFGLQEQSAGELLGQGGGALGGAMFLEVALGRAGDGVDVNGAVPVEPAVFRGQKGLGRIGRQIGQGDALAVLGAARGDHTAVVVQERHAGRSPDRP